MAHSINLSDGVMTALRRILLTLATIFPMTALAEPIRIVAFGDSLTAGYGLAAHESFPAQLQNLLQAKGHNVEVVNMGVSGDTTAGGRSRLNYVLEKKPALVILALGANDMLRTLPPQKTRENLEFIIKNLTDNKIGVILVGMKAASNFGPAFASRFNEIYPDLADDYDLPFYPFFLEKVALRPELNLPDGLHPNAQGVKIMTESLLPLVEKTLADHS